MPNKGESIRFLPIRRITYSLSLRTNGKEIMNFKEQYFSIWQQGWELHKNFFGTSANDEKTWQRLNQECEQLDKQYADKPERKFVQTLLLAVGGELERAGKHGQQN